MTTMGRQTAGLEATRRFMREPDVSPARAWLEQWRLHPAPIDALWHIPARAIPNAHDPHDPQAAALVGWRLRPVITRDGPIALVSAEPVLPPALRTAAAPGPARLRVTEDADLLHFDPLPDAAPPRLTLVLKVEPAPASWVYIRTDLFERLGIPGGRYERRPMTPIA